MERSSENKIKAAAVIIAAIVLIAVAASMFSKKEDASQADSATTSQPSDDVATSSDSSSTTTPDSWSAFKNGTYTVSDTYSSPGGIEDIKVTLTLNNNTITDVSVVQEANNNESAEYQEKFQDSYKSKVVGKALSSLQLSRSSGASLTTNAFNDALDQLRSQAKA